MYTICFANSQIVSFPTLLNPMVTYTTFVLIGILLLMDTVDIKFSFDLLHGYSRINFFSYIIKTFLLVSSICLLFISKEYLNARQV